MHAQPAKTLPIQYLWAKQIRQKSYLRVQQVKEAADSKTPSLSSKPADLAGQVCL